MEGYAGREARRAGETREEWRATEQAYANELRRHEGAAWELARALKQSCRRRAHEARAGGGGGEAEEEEARCEESTWKLLLMLLPDRYRSPAPVTLTVAEGRTRTPGELAARLRASSSAFRQVEAVRRWLEWRYARRLRHEDPLDAFFADASAHRTACLLLRGRGGPGLVSELDPDAPLRQRARLVEQDHADEALLLRQLWRLVRAGRLGYALDLCRRCGQPWRAASLRGAALFDLPDPEPLEGADMEAAANAHGNATRAAWKQAAARLAEEERLEAYERALYGALAGRAEAAFPVCGSWEDALWALTLQALEQRLDLELARRPPLLAAPPASAGGEPEVAVGAVEEDGAVALGRLLERVRAAVRPELRQGLAEPHAALQAALLAGGLEDALHLLAGWVQRGPLPAPLRRFAAHLALFARALRPDQFAIEQGSPSALLLGHYLDHLIESGQSAELVALYAARLPPPARDAAYLHFMQRNVSTREGQAEALAAAAQAGLDPRAISRALVERLTSAPSLVAAPAATAEQEERAATPAAVAAGEALTEEERRRVAALDWLTHESSPEQRAELLRQSNRLARRFLRDARLPALHAAVARVPPALPAELLRAGHRGLVREHTALRDYLRALQLYNEWLQTYAHAPQEPEAARPGASTAEVIQLDSRRRAYLAELHQWNAQECARYEAARDALLQVLRFEGGWLRDSPADTPPPDPADPSRLETLSLLRRRVLPDLCFLLHDLHFRSQRYHESIQLTKLVADERHKLYELFTPSDLQRLLRLIRDSELALMAKSR